MLKVSNVEVMNMHNAIPIKGYENYKVDRLGNVYNSKGQLLKKHLTSKGYVRVTLSKHQKHKHFSVHRLVAQAFIPNPNNYPQVNHIDYDKTNNQVENLEWCSLIQNLEYSNIIYKASLKKERKVKCLETNEIFNSVKEACNKYNLHHANVVACCNGRRKKCGGLTWLYQM